MNTKNRFIKFLSALPFMALYCTEGPTAGIEISNGDDCVGTIYNKDGSVAIDAVVRLIPCNYYPGSDTTSVDSILTDKNGNYSFNVNESAYYNIIAVKGGTSCIQDSVAITVDTKTKVNNDTLEVTGVLSGRIQMKPGDDPRNAVILVLGTNVFTTPSDTSGLFSLPPLPPGAFTIRIFSPISGYDVVDTGMIIRSGAASELMVSLRSTDAPVISNFTVTYDSATMYATLQWSMPDTSNAVSYILKRKSKLENDSIIMLSNDLTSYTDDLVKYDGDTINYRIAAVGRNYKTGYEAESPDIVVCGKVYCIEKFSLSTVTADATPYGDLYKLYTESGRKLYFSTDKRIIKTDASGNLQCTFHLPDTSKFQENYFYGPIQEDDSSHLYAWSRSYDCILFTKFDENLNVLAQKILDTIIYYVNGYIEVTGNSSIFSFSSESDGINRATAIKNYAPDLTFNKSFRIEDLQMWGTDRFGDTMVVYAIHPEQIHQYDRPYIHFYDTTFTEISSIRQPELSNSIWCPHSGEFDSMTNDFLAAPVGVFVSTHLNITEVEPSTLLVFTDKNGRFLSRIVIPASRLTGLYFDTVGNLYFMDTHWGTYDVDVVTTTMFKYTMKALVNSKP
jgi:hypothetical protein